MKALVVVNCFPPLLKGAGGVSKRYLTLCRGLIDGLGWKVTLMTPVNVQRSAEPDVLRWIHEGGLTHLPARGVRIESKRDGVAVFLDLFSAVNMSLLVNELCVQGDYDCVFMDDIFYRLELLLLVRAMGLPSVVSTHTDITHSPSCKGAVKMVWNLQMLSAHLASVHATVSKVFGAQMREQYQIPVTGVWPAIVWSAEFRSNPAEWEERALEKRRMWLDMLRKQGCEEPKAIMLFAGRWSAEKRIHLLFDAVPKNCALVICGDGTSDYAGMVMQAGPASGRSNVLPLRKMLGAKDLRLAYAASDLFLSASNFETLGNTVIESFCSGTPVAVQPAQGHLEFVVDGKNSYFVDFADAVEARASLTRIVESGLDRESLRRNLPELEALGQRLRDADFAKDFEASVIEPALEVGRKQSLVGGEVNVAVELAKRVACLTLCIIAWVVLRLVTRVAFVTSSDPKFAVLGPLGSAVDDGKLSTVFTWPWMRLLFGGQDSSGPSPSLVDPSDSESHYRVAIQRAMRKWFGPSAELAMISLTIFFLVSGCVPLFG